MLFSAIIIKDIYKKNNNNVSMRNNYRHLCKSRYIKSRILTHFWPVLNNYPSLSFLLSFFFTQSLLHQNKETNLNGEQRNGFK